MIASRIGRAATRFGPTRFGGSSSAIIGSAIAHSSSDTRQIGGNGCRSFLRFAILHLRLSTRCSLYASLEIVTNPTVTDSCGPSAVEGHDGEGRSRPRSGEGGGGRAGGVDERLAGPLSSGCSLSARGGIR